MGHKSADDPTSDDGREYHIKTLPGDLAERCLLVGSPARAELIAEQMLEDAVQVDMSYRKLFCFTGKYSGVPVSVATSGMGCPSEGIVMPEAYKTGARAFIRVGSCGALWEETQPGDSAICMGAARYDGASVNWADLPYPAVPDPRFVLALMNSAKKLGLPYHIGVGVTTDCFNEGQARPDPLSKDEYVPPHLKARHEWLIRNGALFYSMEEAALFVWCLTHGGIPCGAIDAIYCNRITGVFEPVGDEAAARIALDAFAGMSDDDLLPLRQR